MNLQGIIVVKMTHKIKAQAQWRAERLTMKGCDAARSSLAGSLSLLWWDHSQLACCCSLPVVVTLTLWPYCGGKSCNMRILIRINQAKPQWCWFEFMRKLKAINTHACHGSMNNNRIQLIWSFHGKNCQVTQLAGGAWLNSGKWTFCQDVLIYSNISNNPGRLKVFQRMKKNGVSIHFFGTMTGFNLHHSNSVVVLVSIIFQIQFSPVSNPLYFFDTESAITHCLNYSLNRPIEQLMTLVRP